ncbi:Gp138 family membrane-puncturing spike protein [Paenibacillus sp. 32352]|uniref:Gp138 family membrane-puncturing spike protein n=1 Tax=Paenibacillus sp. 32352 TaxID=1969111 RepID=UPI0009AC7FEF|nr:Gp138 family membrane-puncturing spike protein [Paenibacillus sp. 32352]
MSKLDPAGVLAELIQSAIKKNASDLRVAFPCRVLSFETTTGMAVVQPLLQMIEGAAPSPIQNVPALGQKMRTTTGEELALYPLIQKDDIVYVVCADRHMKTAQTGVVSKPDSDRMHSHNDAVIVGVFPCSLPSS